MIRIPRLAALGAAALVAALSAQARAQTVYALTTQGGLISFDASSPGAINFIGAISGAGGVSETLTGIDFRPATSELYLVGRGDVFDSLYTLNLTNATATFKSNLSLGLSGSSFGVDFNPVPDRLRLISSSGQNLRTNVDTGAVSVDSTLTYALGDSNFGDAPFVVASAYTNSLFGVAGGTGATLLYNLDARDNILVRQGSPSPNDGTLTTIGAVGVDFGEETGFDIYYNGSTNTAYASFVTVTDGGSFSQFYSIDLATGAGTFLGTIGGSASIRDIAVIPAPGAAALLSLGALVGLRRRR